MKNQYRLNALVISFIAIIFIFSGCSFINMMAGPEEFKKLTEWEHKKAEQYQQYVGMSKEEIMKKFGKPSDFKWDAPYATDFDKTTGKWIHKKGEETLTYEFQDGIPHSYGNAWMTTFHFRDEIVVGVRVDTTK